MSMYCSEDNATDMLLWRSLRTTSGFGCSQIVTEGHNKSLRKGCKCGKQPSQTEKQASTRLDVENYREQAQNSRMFQSLVQHILEELKFTLGRAKAPMQQLIALMVKT